MSPTRRVLVLVNVMMLLAWLALDMTVYHALPDTIATHFGASGRANGFAPRSLGSWFGLWGISTAMSVMLLAIGQWVHRRPDIINMPCKTELLGLDQSRRRPLLEEIAVWTSAMSFSCVLLFAAIHYDVWRMATSGQRGLSWVTGVAIALCMVGQFAGTSIWYLQFERRVLEAAKQHDLT